MDDTEFINDMRILVKAWRAVASDMKGFTHPDKSRIDTLEICANRIDARLQEFDAPELPEEEEEEE